MKRAVIYARVSTDRQAEEGLSIDSQIESCRRKAEAMGAVVIHVFRDEGISGTTDARPGFRAAISRCALGDVAMLICWSSSRFARDQHDAITYKRELKDYGTALVYAQSEIDLDSHEGWMLDSFQQIIDESYSRQVAADTKRSMMKAAGEGYFMGGRVPYGYQAVTAADGKRRKLIPSEAEAAVVRRIFFMASQGIGALLIAKQLNDAGMTLHGRPWTKGSILYLLKSEVYVGVVIYNRIERKSRKTRPEDQWRRVQSHEPLVSADVFSLVQQGLGQRAPTPEVGSASSTHFFTGLLRCGLCDSSLQIITGKGRTRVYSYYGCRARNQGVACDFKPMRADQFDPWMLEQLMDKLLSPDAIQRMLDQLEDVAQRWISDRSKRRAALVLELRGVEGRRNKLFDVLEVQGAAAPGLTEMAPRLRQLNDQAKKLEAALQALENEPVPEIGRLEISAEEAAEVFRSTIRATDDPKATRAFVAGIADKITVRAYEVEVLYKPECLIQMDGASVRSKHSWLPDLGSNQGPTD